MAKMVSKLEEVESFLWKLSYFWFLAKGRCCHMKNLNRQALLLNTLPLLGQQSLSDSDRRLAAGGSK